MSLPLIADRPTTQNERVNRYFVPSDETPPVYRLDDPAGIENVIRAAYRQIFSEHLMLESYRQKALESQLRNGAISVKEFIRGLGKSEVYRDLVMVPNDNYRFVEITFQRFLGRPTYSQMERIKYSIILATRGLDGFIDAIVDSEEYDAAFGDDVVPYQRRRLSEKPTNLVTPRYGARWRDISGVRPSAREVVRTYRVVRLPKPGDPENFLNMARMLNPKPAARQNISVFDLKIPDMTTNRR
ncbi:phycobilisome rod-core linker polypeptide [Synechococcus sp. W70.1]|uniref:phycobilisome rod-core linker polypeptide n=1 Tax=Synechococcus sp. W70.1 TaxID=2964534 RepID=UPI0039C12481